MMAGEVARQPGRRRRAARAAFSRPRRRARRWGRMTAHQMICHLRDAFLMGTAARPVSDVAHLANRTIIKWIALYGPVALAAG